MVLQWFRRRSRAEPDRAAPPQSTSYPGDYSGSVRIEYRPHPDGKADPGEVVWGWVPFEEDHSRGKDRPVLVIGHDGPYLLALMLTSKDHNRDAAAEARNGRHWLDVGAGGWDGQHRPSEVRLDRVLRLRPEQVRREGATLPRPIFDQVAGEMAALKG
ncbi:MAG: type II toxin-antitoxin system PemK/MazF family toxin [Actinomycetota bacterium]|nr:type II toxin-antitoxin system PemK/MazF family toxin [Actinomycetota bacterium]MDQ2958628.1 type II toxin-antitoxin system PemK/MazF family toxin [Actinomycetota bacterium]